MKQLFELPEYDYAFAEFYRTAVYELMRRKDPLDVLEACPAHCSPLSTASAVGKVSPVIKLVLIAAPVVALYSPTVPLP